MDKTSTLDENQFLNNFEKSLTLTRLSSSEESGNSLVDEINIINDNKSLNKVEQSSELFLNPDIIERLRRYSETWFQVCSIQLKMG